MMNARKVVHSFLIGLMVNGVAIADSVVNDDSIISGSQCVGIDCNNGESFSFDTLRLKENNLRIHFQDTSSSAAFPTADWRIIINDSSNGGQNYFGIEDSTTTNRIFTIRDTAPAHSFYMSQSGNIGFGTSSPVTDLHVNDSDTPTLRLEQNMNSGWQQQSWDIGGNEVNFFVRDTNSGSLPFRIAKSAPTDSAYLSSIGYLGVGTSNPTAKLHLVDSTNTGLHIENTINAENVRTLATLTNNGGVALELRDTSSGGEIWQMRNNNGFTIRQGNDAVLSLNSSGNLTVSGTICGNDGVDCIGTIPSSRQWKTVVSDVNVNDVLKKVSQLAISTWRYNHQSESKHHIGPMAEDFHRLFSLNGDENTKIASVDANGVALAAIQALHTQLEQKNEEIAELKADIAEIKQILSQQ